MTKDEENCQIPIKFLILPTMILFKQKIYKGTNRKLSQITLLGPEGWVMGELSAYC